MEQNKQSVSSDEIIVERNVIKSEISQSSKIKGQKILREDTPNNPDETGSGVPGVGADDM